MLITQYTPHRGKGWDGGGAYGFNYITSEYQVNISGRKDYGWQKDNWLSEEGSDYHTDFILEF